MPKAKTGFDHDGKTYHVGDDVSELSDAALRDLSARGLVEGVEGVEAKQAERLKPAGHDTFEKDAQQASNKKEPEPIGVAGGLAGNRAGDILAGDESVRVANETRQSTGGKPRQTK